MHGNFKNFNKKILDTIKNFTPNLVIFGHVYNIENKIFEYCKSNNIKTANWFIDSISNEFLNGKKRQDFLNLVNNVDKCFLTSSPELFKNNTDIFYDSNNELMIKLKKLIRLFPRLENFQDIAKNYDWSYISKNYDSYLLNTIYKNN